MEQAPLGEWVILVRLFGSDASIWTISPASPIS
jgi:hypothetical protein